MAARSLQQGLSEVKVNFEATKTKPKRAIEVILRSAAIIAIQKHNPPTSPIFQSVCKSMIETEIQSLQNQHPLERSTKKLFASYTDSADAHCFTLPFRSSNDGLMEADKYSRELSLRLANQVPETDNSSSRYFENSLQDSIGRDCIVVLGMDVNTLKPRQCLNDTIIKFWLNWLSTPRSPCDIAAEVHVFSSFFISGVMDNGYNQSMQKWLKRVNIFERKLLIFPVHAGHHWSLVAVINPKLIMQTKRGLSTQNLNYTGDVSCMIHFDSLGSFTIHDRAQIGNVVRLVLNKEWERYYNNAIDKTNLPFNHRSFKLHCPFGKSHAIRRIIPLITRIHRRC